MMQMKLFELFDTNDFINLVTEFGEESVVKFSETIIGITYDYGANSYIDLLKKVKDFNLRQVINTSSRFIQLIDYCVDNDLFINKISFIYPIPKESTEYLEDYIENINSSTGAEKLTNKLKFFKEVNWIISDECIDLQSISFQLIEQNSKLYTDVQLYNNGVLLVDDQSVLPEVEKIINTIYM